MPPTTRTLAPALPDEIIEEIFLRLPPNEPACLVRASLTSKLWLALLSGPNFHGRYHEVHGAAPMLGFLYFCPKDSRPEPEAEGPVKGFMSTTKFGAHITPGEVRDSHYGARDCRHGRVLLLGDTWFSPTKLVIWNPMTCGRKELYPPLSPTGTIYRTYGAVVLCDTTGCDHRACHEGPSRVVFVGLQDTIDGSCVAFAHVSLPHEDVGSESCSHLDEWSEPCSGLHLPEDADFDLMPPVFTEDAIYFILSYDYNYNYGDDYYADDNDEDEDDYYYDDDDHRIAILKYDLVSNCLSLSDGPLAKSYINGGVFLMFMEDGNLGFARVNKLTLYLWSRKIGSDGIAPWNACRVIDLKEFSPFKIPRKKLGLLDN